MSMRSRAFSSVTSGCPHVFGDQRNRTAPRVPFRAMMRDTASSRNLGTSPLQGEPSGGSQSDMNTSRKCSLSNEVRRP